MLKYLLILLFLWANLSAKVTIDTDWGFSFVLPKEWKYQKNTNVILLGHNQIAGLIVVYPHNLNDMKTLQYSMQEGLNDDGVSLHPNSKINKMQENILVATYNGIYDMQEAKAKGYATLAPDGGGAIIIAISTPQSFSKNLSKASDTLVKSIKYLKRNSSQNIKQKFIGQWTTMTKYSESSIYFYPDGTYTYNNESSYGNSDTSVGATWGLAQNNQNRGRWSAIGSLRKGEIILTEPNGETSRYPYQVHIKNGTVYPNEYYFGNTFYFKK